LRIGEVYSPGRQAVRAGEQSLDLDKPAVLRSEGRQRRWWKCLLLFSADAAAPAECVFVITVIAEQVHRRRLRNFPYVIVIVTQE